MSPLSRQLAGNAAGLQALLAWPGPPAAVDGGAEPPRAGVFLWSLLLSLLACAVIAFVSLLGPVGLIGGHGWQVGLRLVLFCHPA